MNEAGEGSTGKDEIKKPKKVVEVPIRRTKHPLNRALQGKEPQRISEKTPLSENEPIFIHLSPSPRRPEIISEGIRIVKDGPKDRLGMQVEGIQILLDCVKKDSPQNTQTIDALVQKAEEIDQDQSDHSYLGKIYLTADKLDDAKNIVDQMTGEEKYYLIQEIVKKYLANGDITMAEEFAKNHITGERTYHLLTLVADAQFQNGDEENAERNLASSMKSVEENLLDSLPLHRNTLRVLESMGEDHPKSQQVQDAIVEKVEAELEKIKNDEDLSFPKEIPQKRVYLQQYRESQMLLFHSANILANIGRIEQAKAIGDTLTEGRKDELDFTLAETYERRGDIDKAVETLRPSTKWNRAKFMNLLIKSGQIDEARGIAQGNTMLTQDLAMAVAKRGDYEAAIQILRSIEGNIYSEKDFAYDEAKVIILSGSADEVETINRLPIHYSYDAKSITEVLALLYEKTAA